ncbi:MAG: nucleoside triphosphate pyrophosphohydrolase [Gemmatimonadota bacterium]
MNQKQSDALERVMDLVRYLRAHCPWDAAQTPRSLIPYLLEEAHESADAIAHGDDDALRAELGDLLLNIAFQLVLGEEREAFGAADVADTVIEKMERRHPHLFGLGEPEGWEALKARERGDDAGLLHGLASGLDPLSRAHRIQDRVAGVGFDWEDARGAFEKVVEELEEVREVLFPADGPGAPRAPAPAALEEELGDLLFAVVNLARLAGSHALTALHAANAKFTRRFEALERLAVERGVDLGTATLDELETLWQAVKAAEDR